MEYIRRRATVGFVIAGMAIGGNEKSVAMLSKALSDEYDICIIVFNGENISNNYSGELIDLREPARSGMFNKIIVSMRRLWKLKKIIAQRKIDVLFTFTNSLNAVSHYSFANVKKIVSCRDCGDLINRTKYYAHMAKVSDYMIFNSKFMQNYF